MNQSFLLHIVERLEGFAGKLPSSIQKAVLVELTPVKELFLRQRSPRFVLTGSARPSAQEILPLLFGADSTEKLRDVLMPLFHWQKIEMPHGAIDLLDTRGADAATLDSIRDELARQAPDLFLHVVDDESALGAELRQLASFQMHNAKVIALTTANATARNGSLRPNEASIRAAFNSISELRDKLLQVIAVPSQPVAFLASVARDLPHEVRVEIARMTGDRAAQTELAQLLVKSTAAICTAVGAQPIPLADLPILTTLQLVMVAGIMYISGRERSLRAATEFVGALGANVGAGMVLREATRAALKFFPGWGNLVCGMVAGAGTYAIGRAAIVYFVEGMSLKDARRAYLASRKRRAQREFLPQTVPRGGSIEPATHDVNNS